MLSPFHPLQLVLGLIVWSLWFVIAYAGLSLGCQLAPAAPPASAFNWLNLSLLGLTLVIGTLLLWWAYRCWQALKHETVPTGLSRYTSRFVASLAFSVNLTAGLATLAVGAPTVVLLPCV